MPGRILRANRIQASDVLLGASSNETAAPVSWFVDQQLGDAPMTMIGFDVVTGIFDKIDFNRGGVKVATLAAGSYATGAAMAAAIVAALEAADPTPVWACSYDVVTKKYTISSDLAFELLFGTGTNVLKSIHPDIGFATADTGSATTHTAGTAVYQSRKWFHADLRASLALTVAIARYHNAGAGGTFKLRGSATSVADALTNASPALAQTLAGNSDIRIVFFGSTSVRYVVLLIEDQTNPDGFSRVGKWYAGTYDETAVNYSIDYVEEFEELSTNLYADGGAHYTVERPDRLRFVLNYEEVEEADRTILKAVKEATPAGRCFFIALRPTVEPTDTVYGSRPGPMVFSMGGPAPAGGSYWNISLPFEEALP